MIRYHCDGCGNDFEISERRASKPGLENGARVVVAEVGDRILCPVDQRPLDLLPPERFVE